MAGERNLLLRPRQRLAGGHAQLPLDQVDAGDEFRHRVLDLQAGVHLQEGEAPGLIEQKLDRASAAVADGRGQGDGRRAQLGPQCGRDDRRRRLFDHLLVAALDAALALAQVQHVAVVVAEDLHLDVARARHGPLQQQVAVAKGRRRLAPRPGQRRGQFLRPVHQAHSSPAATGRGLDHQRVADALRFAGQRRLVLRRAVVAGQDGQAQPGRQPPRGALVAHGGDGLRRWADKDQPGGGAGAGELGVLGQEAVAGVNGAGPGAGGGAEEGGDVEVGVGRRGGAEAHSGVGGADVGAIGVGVGVDGHGAEAQLMTGADDAQGDLAAVGD